jgi:oxygen-dependent protoporphyrinogen oxidase
VVSVNQKEIAIVGGGITGLVLAYRLQRSGKSVVLIEQGSCPGGAIRSKQCGPYLLEMGPNTVLGKKSLLGLVRDLDLEDCLQTPEACSGHRYIALAKRGKLALAPVPNSLWTALCSPLIPWSLPLSLCGELLLCPSAAQDIDVGSFVARHFGKRVRDYLIDPVLSGIWAADISSLSARTALPKLWDWDQSSGSIIRGAVAESFRNRCANTSSARLGGKRERMRMISFPGGLRELPQSIASALSPSTLLLNSRVKSMTIHASNAVLVTELLATEDMIPGQEEVFEVDKVIITTDAPTSAQLLEVQYPELAREISSVPYAPVGVVHYAVDKSAMSVSADGFGFLIPSMYGKALLGVIFSSSIFANRAPEDKVLLTCISGGAVRPHLADVENLVVLQQVLKELSEVLGLTVKGDVLNARHYPRAIPNYSIGHHQLQERIMRLSRDTDSIHFSTNWLSGIGIADRVEHAENLAREIAG